MSTFLRHNSPVQQFDGGLPERHAKTGRNQTVSAAIQATCNIVCGGKLYRSANSGVGRSAVALVIVKRAQPDVGKG